MREENTCFKYLSDINYTKQIIQETFFQLARKTRIAYVELKTFLMITLVIYFYTDIKNALLCSFDKIFVSSMNSKNFPKKNINNFSKNNIIYSDFSMDSNIEEIENIERFSSIK